MFGSKKKTDFVDRQEILSAKNEALRLTTNYSYEDIGKAFVESTRHLSYDEPDDGIKARFVGTVSFQCLMGLQAKLSKLAEPVPPKPKPVQTAWWKRWMMRLGR